MRGEILRHAVAARTPKSLVVRGGLVHTFGSLATFLAVTFLCSGIYIIEDTLANPIATQAAALIAGAFSTALAAILIYYLIRPRKRAGLAGQKRPRAAVSAPGTRFFDEALQTERQNDSRKDLVYQRLYVDRTRIRP
jgi:hypothetical protein